MAELEVKVQKIYKIHEHPNADRLEVSEIQEEGGWMVITGKGQYKEGDLVIYLPTDTLLSDDIMDSLAKNKVTMKSNRLRAAKIRGVFSEGLCLDPKDWLEEDQIFEGNDVTKILGLTKYEPKPDNRGFGPNRGKGVNCWATHDGFAKYTDIRRIQTNPGCFKGKEVVATIKVHGTNHRCGVLTKEKFSWWEKIKNFFNLSHPMDKKEFFVGSHKTIRGIGKKADPNIVKNTDTYWKVAIKYDLEDKLKAISIENDFADVIIYGEAYGGNIQKGYSYGIPPGEVAYLAFDIMINGKYVDYSTFKGICTIYNIPTVKEVFRGKYDPKIHELAQVKDTIGDWTGDREGIVIKTVKEERDVMGRNIKKVINPNYLLKKSNTDFH